MPVHAAYAPDFGAEESFGQAAKRFQEHYGFEVGRTTVLRVVERHAAAAQAFVHERLEAAQKKFDEPLATRPGVERMLVELDGCEIRTGTLRPAETDERSPLRQGDRIKSRRSSIAWRCGLRSGWLT